MSKHEKKVGIINHWMVNNYGALLLAYALEVSIHRLGYDVESITYLPDEVARPWKVSMIKKVGFFNYLLRLGYFAVFILPRQKSFAGLRTKMNTSKNRYNDDTIRLIEDKYDKIVIGGDQLWNTKVNYYNENNFLPFVKRRNKKVVYAASIAQEYLREDIKNRFQELVEDFGYVTSRETLTQEIIESYTNKKAPRVADPAFLLTAEEWASLAQEDRNAPQKFVFVYQVQSDVELINFAQELAVKNNCEVIYCPFPLKKQIKCKRKPYISPEEWLWYIKNAQYVVTDAFHGTVFSIMFNTQFYSQVSSYGRDTGSRITNILEVLSLEDRLLVNGKCLSEAAIHFTTINEKIEDERKMSLNHLLAMLELT